MSKLTNKIASFGAEAGLYYLSFEHSPLPALITDKSLGILHANYQARILFGVNFNEDPGRRNHNRLNQYIAKDSVRLYEWLNTKNESFLNIVLRTPSSHQKIALHHEQLTFEGSDVHHFVLLPADQPTDGELDLYRNVYQRSGQAIYITDANNVILTASRGLTELSGFFESDLLGSNASMLYTSEESESLEALRRQMSDERQNWQTHTNLTDKLGKSIRCNIHISVVDGKDDSEPNSGMYVHMVENVSSQIQMEKKLKRAARIDSLTGLNNREGFNAHYQHIFQEAQRDAEQLTLFFIDLDNFKIINDRYGHNFGDQVLQETSQRLLSTVGKSGFVARLGGDEFTVLLSEALKKVTVTRMAESIIKALSAPFDLKGIKHQAGASIGIAQYPYDGITPEALLIAADKAMYKAKSIGRNTFQFYDANSKVESSAKELVRKQVAFALNERQIKPYYQGVHNMKSGEIVGFEALVRMLEGDSVINPDMFLAEIETDELVIQLGKRIISDVIHDVSAMKAFGIHAPVSVNLSSFQLCSEEIIHLLERSSERVPDATNDIRIEITETLIFENDDQVRKNVSRLIDCGYSIVLDDFGTGYSSIYTLKQFDFSAIKIDQNFIQDIGRGEKNTNLLAGIISLVSRLNIDLICEGVEQESQQAHLLEAGCEFAQGHFYSKPEPLNAVLKSDFYK